jgi:hypothetical protein
LLQNNEKNFVHKVPTAENTKKPLNFWREKVWIFSEFSVLAGHLEFGETQQIHSLRAKEILVLQESWENGNNFQSLKVFRFSHLVVWASFGQCKYFIPKNTTTKSLLKPEKR